MVLKKFGEKLTRTFIHNFHIRNNRKHDERTSALQGWSCFSGQDGEKETKLPFHILVKEQIK